MPSHLVFVTCGTSLRTASRCWKNLDHRSDEDDEHEADALRARILGGPTSEVMDAFDEEAWTRPHLGRLPAELATLKCLDGIYELGESDTLALIAGDSPELHLDVLAELVGALPWRGRGHPRVTSIVEPYLDATTPELFAAGLEKLLEKAAGVARGFSGAQMILALTGGYKATAAAMALLPGRLRREASIPPTIKAVYLHENSPRLINIPTDPNETVGTIRA